VLNFTNLVQEEIETKKLKAVREAKKVLLKIFESERVALQKWLVRKMIEQGIEPKFTKVIAQYDREGEGLFLFEKAKARLFLDPQSINWAMKSIIQDYEKVGLSEKDALRAPIRLQELQKHNLPIGKTTIRRNHETLIKKRKELEKLGIPVNSGTLACNPNGAFIQKKYKSNISS